MPLLELLQSCEPTHPDDPAIRERFIRFVKAHPDCLERSLQVGHVTASAWVVDSTRSMVLLVHHRKLDRWLQPGGHVDGCAETELSARREVLEETGLSDLVRCGPLPFDLDIHPIPGHGTTPAHHHYDIRYAFRLTGDQSLVVSEESHEVAWAPIDRLEDYDPDPSLLRMRTKWLAVAPGLPD
ncbi:MAG: NUDIX hydrolase [Opitutaceae bacterium]